MATIQFLTATPANFPINNLAGSGLGFMGASFGSSVAVGSFQTTTWVTDANGTIAGPQCNNITWAHPSSGAINGAAAINLLDIPSYLATLNVRFTHSSAIKTQNEQVRIYDRTSISNDPSGVLCKVAQIAHASFSQSGSLGSGDSSWKTPTGSSVVMNLVFSNPQTSGLRLGGPAGTDTQHDFYFSISESPSSIGSKNLQGMYFQLEYL